MCVCWGALRDHKKKCQVATQFSFRAFRVCTSQHAIWTVWLSMQQWAISTRWSDMKVSLHELIKPPDTKSVIVRVRTSYLVTAQRPWVWSAYRTKKHVSEKEGEIWRGVRGTEETRRVKRRIRRKKCGGAEDGIEDKENMFWHFYVRAISIDLHELPTKPSGFFVLGTVRNSNWQATSHLPYLTRLSVSRLCAIEQFETITTTQTWLCLHMNMCIRCPIAEGTKVEQSPSQK